MKLEEIIDWIWEELKLPDLKPKRTATLDEPDYVREGWDKRGARSRLDRSRTVKEAVKTTRDPGKSGRHHQRGPALPPAGEARHARRRTRR